MSLRDDLEAARERVTALERDVAAARARQKEDRQHIAELHLLVAKKPRPEFDDPSAREMSRIMVGLIVFAGLALLARIVLAWLRYG